MELEFASRLSDSRIVVLNLVCTLNLPGKLLKVQILRLGHSSVNQSLWGWDPDNSSFERFPDDGVQQGGENYVRPEQWLSECGLWTTSTPRGIGENANYRAPPQIFSFKIYWSNID